MGKAHFKIELTDHSDGEQNACYCAIQINGTHGDIVKLLAVTLVKRPDLLYIIHDAVQRMEDVDNVVEITLPKF
jgi:hypothetical protein